MKFNKDFFVFIVIATVILLGWNPLMKFLGYEPTKKSQTTAVSTSAVNSSESVAPAVNTTAPSVASAIVDDAGVNNITTTGSYMVEADSILKIPAEVLSNNEMSIKFSSPDLAYIDSFTMLDYKNSTHSGQIVLNNNLNSTLTPALQAGALAVSGYNQWKVVNLINHGRVGDGNSYQVERQIVDASGNEFILIQTWTLNEQYILDYQISFLPVDGKSVALGTVQVSGGDLQSWAQLSGDKVRGSFDKVDYVLAGGEFESFSADSKDESFIENSPVNPVEWIGLSNKYFAVALKGDQPFTPYTSRIGEKKSGYLVATGANLANVTVPSEGSCNFNFSYYVGPKIDDDLIAFDKNASSMMHLSWGPINYLARYMLVVLVWLKSICGSYGWSIILLTLAVRILFFPVTRKANLAMKKMSTVQPKIKELREKYKDQPQILNQKTMELYRDEKINPLGGCFPILLQIPVFFSLYAALNGAIQLRQVPFLWSADLAGPDTVAHIFGLGINPLVITMTALMVLQQVITPSAMEPAQKKIMYIMPVMMLFFFYDLPSGLTLYWTVSQIFSILQMELQRKWDHKGEAPTTLPAK